MRTEWLHGDDFRSDSAARGSVGTSVASVHGALDVLYADGNPTDAENTLHLLEQYRFANRLIRVQDGVEALDWLLRRGAHAHAVHDPARRRLALLDLNLPKLDGMNVLKVMRATPELTAIPVVMLVSTAEEKDLIRECGIPVQGCLVKPLAFGTFMQTFALMGFAWLALGGAGGG